MAQSPPPEPLRSCRCSPLGMTRGYRNKGWHEIKPNLHHVCTILSPRRSGAKALGAC
jgi:hypothetical protein